MMSKDIQYLNYLKNILDSQLEDNKNGLSIDRNRISNLLIKTSDILKDNNGEEK